MHPQPLTAVIVGAGHRSVAYASYSKPHPDELRIVGVADPDDNRRQRAAALFDIPGERCYRTAEELAAQPAFADVAFNGTMDRQHVETTLPLLEAGYDVLLEKPIAPTEAGLLDLLAAARRTGRKLMICHVLRYAPFYVEIRQRVAAGEIGTIIALHTAENVSYHHMAAAFIRGKWSRREDSNPMLMSKCCHDLDLAAWMKSGVAPARVASFGSLMYFRPENAPPGSGTRCLVDCTIEETCPYSARKNYIEQGLWGYYAWEPIEHLGDHSVEQRLESLRTDNPYGRCVWRCDNDVVDHQSVVTEFADGCVATHDMVGGVARPCRTIHLVGTTGEIEGTMEEGAFAIRRPDARAGHEYSETPVDLSVSADMHGGGDMRLVEDFLRVVRGEPPSISTTEIADSMNGHLVAFAADRAMLEGRVVAIESTASGD